MSTKNTVKKKFTYYLTPLAEKQIKEMYHFSGMTDNEETKSDIICKAIGLLHDKVLGKLENK